MATGTLTAEQLVQIDTQMAALNEAQLELERKKRRAEAGSDVFPKARAIAIALKGLEEYANGVIKDWESRRASLTIGTPTEELEKWAAFQGFLASTHAGMEGDFGIAQARMSDVEQAIWPDLIGKRPRAKSRSIDARCGRRSSPSCGSVNATIA